MAKIPIYTRQTTAAGKSGSVPVDPNAFGQGYEQLEKLGKAGRDVSLEFAKNLKEARRDSEFSGAQAKTVEFFSGLDSKAESDTEYWDMPERYKKEMEDFYRVIAKEMKEPEALSDFNNWYALHKTKKLHSIISLSRKKEIFKMEADLVPIRESFIKAGDYPALLGVLDRYVARGIIKAETAEKYKISDKYRIDKNNIFALASMIAEDEGIKEARNYLYGEEVKAVLEQKDIETMYNDLKTEYALIEKEKEDTLKKQQRTLENDIINEAMDGNVKEAYRKLRLASDVDPESRRALHGFIDRQAKPEKIEKKTNMKVFAVAKEDIARNPDKYTPLDIVEKFGEDLKDTDTKSLIKDLVASQKDSKKSETSKKESEIYDLIDEGRFDDALKEIKTLDGDKQSKYRTYLDKKKKESAQVKTDPEIYKEGKRFVLDNSDWIDRGDLVRRYWENLDDPQMKNLLSMLDTLKGKKTGQGDTSKYALKILSRLEKTGLFGDLADRENLDNYLKKELQVIEWLKGNPESTQEQAHQFIMSITQEEQKSFLGRLFKFFFPEDRSKKAIGEAVRGLDIKLKKSAEAKPTQPAKNPAVIDKIKELQSKGIDTDKIKQYMTKAGINVEAYKDEFVNSSNVTKTKASEQKKTAEIIKKNPETKEKATGKKTEAEQKKTGKEPPIYLTDEEMKKGG